MLAAVIIDQTLAVPKQPSMRGAKLKAARQLHVSQYSLCIVPSRAHGEPNRDLLVIEA